MLHKVVQEIHELKTAQPAKISKKTAKISEQMDPTLNFQVPAEGLELVILLHTLY